MSGGFLSKETRGRWFLLLLALSAISVVWIFWTYLYVLLYAAVTVVCCWPAYALILRFTRGRAWLASALTTLGLALLVFVPLGIVVWLFVIEVQEISQVLIEMVQSGQLARQIDAFLASFEPPPWLEGFLPDLPELPSLDLPPPPLPEGLAPVAGTVAEGVVGASGHPLLGPAGGAEVAGQVGPWVAEQQALAQGASGDGGWGELMRRLSLVEAQFTSGLQDASLATLRFVGAELPGIVTTVVNLSIDTLFYVFGVLVLFVEGPKLLAFFRRMLPIDERYTDDVFQVFGEFSRNMVVGSIATSVIQGIIAGIGFAIVGLEKVIFLSILVFLGSFVPIIGTPVVWVPVVLYMFGVGDYGMAIFLTLWCLILVGLVDNVLRPLFMRGSSEMHAMLIFLAVFGGMYWMGLAGVLVGPIIVAIFLAFYRIYERDFLGIAAPSADKPPGLASRLIARALEWVGRALHGAGSARAGDALVRLAHKIAPPLLAGVTVDDQATDPGKASALRPASPTDAEA